LSEGEIETVKGMLLRGDKQYDVAAYFGVNGGRIAEISTGQTGSRVTASPADDLPPPHQKSATLSIRGQGATAYEKVATPRLVATITAISL
jgi:hypothetical protein